MCYLVWSQANVTSDDIEERVFFNGVGEQESQALLQQGRQAGTEPGDWAGRGGEPHWQKVESQYT